MSTFTLPDLGEGLPDAEIVEWHVEEGSTIAVDEPLVSMETAKAVVEVPSPIAGKILKLHGKVGDVILTGAPLVEYETAETAQQTTSSKSTTVAGKIEEGDTIIQEVTFQSAASGREKIKAAPSVRAQARRANLDLSQIKGTGPGGAILMADLPGAMERVAPASASAPPEGYTALRGPRRSMAHAMKVSHQSVVPVSLYDTVDISAWYQSGDITVRLVEAIAQAVKAEPALNAWYDTARDAIKVHKTLSLGMAVDSPEGLFVPVLHDIEAQSRAQLRATINAFKTAAENKSFEPQSLKGATFTLSNFGRFAGQYASPIVVPPTVAILGVGRLMQAPVVSEGQVKVGHLLPLSLTFDHRGATGGEATRFLEVLIRTLQAD